VRRYLGNTHNQREERSSLFRFEQMGATGRVIFVADGKPMPHADPPLIRVVIAEHHTMVRDALRLVLESEGRISVVGEASDGDEATRRVSATGPDVLLLDFMMPRVVDGLDALRLLRKHGETSVRTVVLTEAITGTEVVTALQLGAHGVLLKSAMPSVLFECVRAVARGDFWLDSDGTHALARAFDMARATMEPPAARAQTLTAREVPDHCRGNRRSPQPRRERESEHQQRHGQA